MSKILIVTNHSYMLYRFRRALIERLMQEHDVVLSMPFVGHEEDFQAMGLRCIETEVDRRGIDPRKDWKLFSAYRRILKQERPDRVITYSIKPNIYAGLACTLAGVPYCANVQGLGTAFQRRGLAGFVTALYRMALGKAKAVFFENECNAEEFIRRKIIPAEKAAVLPGAGVDLQEYPLTDYPDNEAVRFLYLGRMMKEKGVGELFDAMRRLHEEQGSGVALDLVGFFDDDCRREVECLTEAGVAVFHGFQTDPRPYYAAADCVVLPSYHEGMSNVLLEAAAMGRPVITSDIPGCREAAEDGVSGFLCRARDGDDLYEKLRRMAALTKAQREEMGKAGRAIMERQFDKQAVVEMTVKKIFE